MGWSTEIASDGRVSASVELQLVIPAVPSIEATRVRFRRTGTITYDGAVLVHGTGTKLVKLSGLTPGLSYDFEAATVSGPNESTSATITNQLAPGDTIPPATPSAPTIQAVHLREVTVQTPQVSDADAKGYEGEIRLGAAVVGTFSAPHLKGATTCSATATIAPGSVPYGASLTARVRCRDYTGNVSAFSANSTSWLLSPTVQADYGASTIPTAAIIDSAVTEVKRRLVIEFSQAYSIAAGIGTVTGLSPISTGMSRKPVLAGILTNNLSVSAFGRSATSGGVVQWAAINLSSIVQSGTAELYVI